MGALSFTAVKKLFCRQNEKCASIRILAKTGQLAPLSTPMYGLNFSETILWITLYHGHGHN